MKNTPSEREFVSLVDNKGISKVDCSHIVVEKVKAVPTYGNSVNVGDCGNDDFRPVDCTRTTETVVIHKDIFENAFDDEWTCVEPDPLAHTTIIDHIINLCDFAADSIMVKFIDQQQ
jgi:hypothetical protein